MTENGQKNAFPHRAVVADLHEGWKNNFKELGILPGLTKLEYAAIHLAGPLFAHLFTATCKLDFVTDGDKKMIAEFPGEVVSYAKEILRLCEKADGND